MDSFKKAYEQYIHDDNGELSLPCCIDEYEGFAEHFYNLAAQKRKEELELREERIDELVRSFRDLQEEYEKLMEEREQMLKKSLKVTKITYNDGLFIYRSKTLTRADLSALGYEKGDELRLVIVKTPLAKIIEKK